MILKPDPTMVTAASRRLFGAAIELYAPMVASAVDRNRTHEYFFVEIVGTPPASLEAHDVANLNRLACSEALRHCHVAAITSLIRGALWIEATWREFEANSLLGFAACCRSLLEAAGDTVYSLGAIPLTLAEQRHLLQSFISGRADAVINLVDLENLLVHFSHGRKLTSEEKQLTPLQQAKRTTDYIKALEETGASGAARLYGDLCQIGHPAKSSLDFLYGRGTHGGFIVDPSAEASGVAKIVSNYMSVLADLPSIVFNPGLLILRVLHAFPDFPRIPELRGFSFQGAKNAKDIEACLRK
jgi:hypothetical protein